MTARVGTALTVVLLSTAIAACGMRAQPNSASNVAGKIGHGEVGVATRAMIALNEGDTVTAVALAERAVAATPNDASFRGLLGNAYFAAGRFASAESGYRGSLALMPNQPQLILKLALVSIAQGKRDQAISLLDSVRDAIDPADFGLGLALAGQPEQAAQILRANAQQPGADSRVRQNLALALALSGDWIGARSVAAQDVPADQLDARIQQWMTMAKPTRASDQIAALTGVAAAVSDPGQPQRLALKGADDRLAEAQPAAEQVAAAQPVPQLSAVAAAAPEVAEIAPLPAPQPALSNAAPTPPAAIPQPALSPRVMALTKAVATSHSGGSPAVVQLGAFASRASVAGAWARVSTRYPTLRGYTPVAARFDGERGTVYRLSVKGFASAQAATALCGSLRRSGGACFVRNSAGDAPVQLASR